jgi:uncharacterized protein YgbK (DUF1537 family)
VNLLAATRFGIVLGRASLKSAPLKRSADRQARQIELSRALVLVGACEARASTRVMTRCCHQPALRAARRR